MKLRASLTKNNFFYDFRKSLSLTFLPAVPIAAVLLFFSVFGAADRLPQYYSKYGAFFLDIGIGYGLMSFLLLCGLCMGISLFHVFNRSVQANLLLSAGLTRRQLFFNRSLAGTLMLLLVIELPLTVTLFINMHYYGASVTVLCSYILYSVSIFAVALIGFAVGVLMAVLTGTALEAGLSSVFALFLPWLLIAFVDYSFSIFLRGYFTADDSLSSLPSFAVFPTFALSSPLAQKLYFLNPLYLIFAPGEDGNLFYEQSLWDNYSKMYEGGFSASSEIVRDTLLGHCAIFAAWIILSALILFFARRLFEKRKAEIGGFFKKSKPAAAVVLTAVTLFAAGVGLGAGHHTVCVNSGSTEAPITALGSHDIYTLFSIFLIVPLLTLVAGLVVFKQKRKKFFRSIRYLPLMLLVLLPALYGLFGGLGYAGRVPDAASIEKATMTVIDSPEHLTSQVILPSVSFTSKHVFSSESDIETVTGLHGLLAADSGRTDRSVEGVRSISQTIKIVYQLKDGSSIMRRYAAYSDDTLLRLYDLFDTEEAERVINERLCDSEKWLPDDAFTKQLQLFYFTPEPNFYEMPLSDRDTLHYENVDVTLCASDGFTKTDITGKLDGKAFKKLLSCLAADFRSLSAREFFTPDSPPLCLLMLSLKEQKAYNEEEPVQLPVYASSKSRCMIVPKAFYIAATHRLCRISAITVPPMTPKR